MDGAGRGHSVTFWGFIVLILTIIEAYGLCSPRTLGSRGSAIALLGSWRPVRRAGAGRHHHLLDHPAA